MAKKSGDKVKIKGTEELSINSSLFEEMRKQFDQVLTAGIQAIIDKGISEGTMNLKMNVHVTENDSEDTPNMDTYIPVIDYKINFAYTQKGEQTGITGGADVQLISEGKDKGWFVRNDPYGQMELDLD